MIEFLSSMDNIPFLAALGLTLALAGVELISLLMGAGSLGAIGDASPDVDLNVDTGLISGVDPGVDAGVDFHVDGPDVGDIDLHPGTPGIHPTTAAHGGIEAGTSLFTQSLAWLHLGRLPMMIILVLALMGFGLAGMIAQYVCFSLFGRTMPWWLAMVPAVGGLVLNLRFSGLLTLRYLPQDETQVVANDYFIGKEAVVVLGTAAPGRPAQAKLRDPHGQTHYFMVEPRGDERKPMTPDTRILVIARHGATYKAIVHPLISGTADGPDAPDNNPLTPKES